MKRLMFIILSALLINPPANAFAEVMDPPIVSESAILMDSQTNVVLMAKNERQKMYPASLTKIATAIYAIEKGELGDIVVITKEATETEGTSVYLEEGEALPLEKLIQGMLINSGNDAATAIAIHLSGSMQRFSEDVNEYLNKQVGVSDTHLVNPHGLFAEDHYTTAYDLALITNYAMKNETFREIFGTKELLWDGATWDTTLYTHHYMLKGEIPFQGVTGGKTGFVNESKQTLATTAENGSIKLTAICLKADFKRDIYNDTIQLLSYGLANYKTTVIPSGTKLTNESDTFTLAEPLSITEPISGGAQVVTPTGDLQVVNTQTKERLQTLSLSPYKDKKEVTTKPMDNAELSKQGDMILKNAIYLGVGAFVLLGMVSVKRRINRRVYKQNS